MYLYAPGRKWEENILHSSKKHLNAWMENKSSFNSRLNISTDLVYTANGADSFH